MDLSRLELAPKEEILLTPSPYPHWTIREIFEQPEAMARTLGNGGRLVPGDLVKLGGLDRNAAELLSIQNMVLSGCGTSLYACMYGAKLFRKLKVFNTVSVFDAAEVTMDAFPLQQAGLCVVSQSGETKDTHRTLQLAESLQVPRMSVVNRVGSLIAREAGKGVYLNAGAEHAVASTKAFTTQVTALALVAGWYSQNRSLGVMNAASFTKVLEPHGSSFSPSSEARHHLIQALQRLPISSGMTLRSAPQCKQLAQRLQHAASMFVLGKGFAEPIAYEGALKIKEITYIHAEGFSGGALKHGPFALLDKGTPVILLILNDQHGELMKIAATEVRARGAYTVVISDMPENVREVADEVIPIPENGSLTALLATIPLQVCRSLSLCVD